MTLTNGIKLPASGLFWAKIPNLFGHSSKAAPSEIQDFSSKIDRPAFNIFYWMESYPPLPINPCFRNIKPLIRVIIKQFLPS